MASGRIIHKTLFINEQLAQMELGARLLYVGMIVQADDEGRMKASPKYLKALIFPFDEVIRISSVMAWRDKLSATGLIQLYAAGGQEYLVHPNWEKWQPLRSDRVKPSDCPSPSSGCQLVDISPPNPTQPNQTKPNRTKEAKPPFMRPTVDEIRQYCKERKNNVDAQRFFDYYESKGWVVGRVPMKSWQAAVRTWEKNGFNSNQPVDDGIPNEWKTPQQIRR